MDMLTFAMSGVCVVIMLFTVMCRTDLRKWLGYYNIIDITFTIGMIYMLHGSFGGVISASFGGIAMSATLWIARRVFGAKRLTRKGWVVHQEGSLAGLGNSLKQIIQKVLA